MVHYRSTFAWPLSSLPRTVYKVDVKYNDDQHFVEWFNVNASVTTENGKKVARVKAALLRRPSASFLEQADAVSQELQQLAVIFCEPNGNASRLKHPHLEGDPCVYRGGFFMIDEVEVVPSRKGNSLGLRVLHEVLVLMREHWSLAVMMPLSLGTRWCRWKENSRQPWADYTDPTPEERAESRQNDVLIQKHFGRMGFVQATRASDSSRAWFLTSAMYFSPDDDNPESPISRWLSKEEAAQIDVYQPPEKHQPACLDQELRDVVWKCQNGMNVSMLMIGAAAAPPSQETKGQNIAAIERLVQAGASIHESRALFVAAGLSLEDPYPLQTLFRLGGDVNVPDENGCRPLHVAAAAMIPQNVEFLVNVAGADTGAVDSAGNTPLLGLQDQIRSHSDFAAAFGLSGMPPREIDVMPKYRTLVALMPGRMRSSLIDGWMSPRMRKILTITAEDDAVEDKNDHLGFTNFRPMPLSECLDAPMGIWRIEYIPPAAISHNREGLYKSFADGWRQLFQTMAQILRDGKTPTVRRIQEYTESGIVPSVDVRKYRHFLQKGGRVEFAVDALIRVSRNVVVDGDDGWEYWMCQDEIEALPATAIDGAFDIARFMCINRGGGSLDTCGPHPCPRNP